MRSEVEEQLVAAVGRGDELDLRGADEQVVRAAVLRELLVGPAGSVDARGLRLRGARVDGQLDLDGLRTPVRLRLRACLLPDGIRLRGASLPLLDLGGCTVAGGLLADDGVVESSALLWRGFTASGLVSFVGTRIGGKLDLTGARLDGGRGAALVADRMALSGDLLLDDAVVTGGAPEGAVQLTGTRVGGRLSARGLRATNPAGPALSAANLQVTDTVDVSHGAQLRGYGPHGAVRLVGARVGSVSFGGARVENPAGWAFAGHYLDVAGTVYLDKIVAVGGVRLSGGRVGGQAELTGATIDGGERSALAATRLQAAQGVVLLDATLRSTGDEPTVNLRSARIGGDLAMRGSRLSAGTGAALRLNTATVDGRAILHGLTVTSGDVDLRDSTVGALHDEAGRSLADSAGIYLDGLTYRGVPGGTDEPPPVRDRIRWLARMPRYAAQPYRQLAAAYQAAGHPDDARRVLVAQQEHLRRSGALTGWGRLRHRLFGWFLQYGYQPLRAVALLGVTLAAAALLFVLVADGTRTPTGGPCPVVDRVALAIDTAVPLADTGVDERCALATTRPSGQRLAAAGWVFTVLGWASATLVVAGYTGLVRRP